MIYLANFIIIYFYSFLVRIYSRNDNEFRRLLGLLLSAHIILFRILSYPFDYADTPNYADAYIDISNYSFYEVAFSFHEYTVWGQGYAIFNWFLSRVSTDVMFFFIVSGIMIVGIPMWFYNKKSYTLLLTVSLYLLYPMLYLMSFAVLRQHLAAVIFIVALYNIANYKISIPLSLIAVLFHTSALVFLPFFLWRKIDFSKMNSVKLFLLLCLGVLVLKMGVNMVVGYVSNFLSTDRNADFSEQAEGTNIMPVLILGLMVFMIFKERLLVKCKRIDYEIAVFIIYGFLISIFGIGLSGAGRLSMYFIYFVPVVVSFPFHYSDRVRRPNSLLYAFVLILIFLRQMYYMYSSWVMDFDYKFFWNFI